MYGDYGVAVAQKLVELFSSGSIPDSHPIFDLSMIQIFYAREKIISKAGIHKKLIGPSFVILALGLGSGEVILWPYLTANYGLGIAWGAILGITFQYFMNMEIERYALVKGESVFVGIHKLFKPAVYWFIVSTFIGFGLPGIIAASAKVISVFWV